MIYKGKIIIKILSNVDDKNLGGKDFNNLLIEKYFNYNEFNKKNWRIIIFYFID